MLNMLALERMINMRHVIGNLKNHKKLILEARKSSEYKSLQKKMAKIKEKEKEKKKASRKSQ